MKKLSKIILISSIILFSFIVINLSSIEINYSSHGNSSPPKYTNVISTTITNTTQTNSTQGSSVFLVPIIPYYIILIIFALIASLGFFFATFSREIRRDFIARTVAMFIVIFALIFGLKIFLGSTNQPNSLISDNSFFSIYSIVFLSVFIIVIGFLAYSIISIVLTVRKLRTEKNTLNIKNLREEFISKINKINLKYSGFSFSNPKDYILYCYKSFCEFIEGKGINNPSYLTAREFESYIKKLIGYESNYLHSLTNLFEKAKYSIDEMSNKDAEYASSLLNSILNDLKNVG